MRKDIPDHAFLLEEGKVFFYLNNTDKYMITGKSLIVGATELIMKYISGEKIEREETAITTSSSKLKNIPIEKFKEGLKSFSFLMNTSSVLAKQVKLTNNIINQSIAQLEGDEQKLKEISIEYFMILDRISREYQKRKIPWLMTILNEGKLNLCYKRGEAYYKSTIPTKLHEGVQLSARMVEYPVGSILCEQDSDGTEMYVLQSGIIDVHVDKNRIASISEPGTITGEMALLLGEKRTATLVAKNNVVINKISKEDLKNISARDLSLMQTILETLARRHYYNIVKIEDMTEKIAMRTLQGTGQEDKLELRLEQTLDNLHELQNKVSKFCREKKQDFLDDLIRGFRKK